MYNKILNNCRYTFTIWFTLDPEFQEDHTIMRFLNAHVLLASRENNKPNQQNTKNNNEQSLNNTDNKHTNIKKNGQYEPEERNGYVSFFYLFLILLSKFCRESSAVWDIVQYKREKYGIAESLEVWVN